MKDVYEVLKEKESLCLRRRPREAYTPLYRNLAKIFVLFRLRPGSGRTGKCDWKIGKRFESGGRAEGSL